MATHAASARFTELYFPSGAEADDHIESGDIAFRVRVREIIVSRGEDIACGVMGEKGRAAFFSQEFHREGGDGIVIIVPRIFTVVESAVFIHAAEVFDISAECNENIARQEYCKQNDAPRNYAEDSENTLT